MIHLRYVVFIIVYNIYLFAAFHIRSKETSWPWLFPKPTEPPKDPCITSCDGRESGNYQSCLGCDVFATCVHGVMYDNRSCQEVPWEISWDDNTKRCQNFSDTCPYIIIDDPQTVL